MTPPKIRISGQALGQHLARVTTAHRNAYAAAEQTARDLARPEDGEPPAAAPPEQP